MASRAGPEDFVAAQDRVWAEIEAELAQGRKTGHWIWFVFPQIEGLGRSETARFFALPSVDAARGHLAHPVLGPRLLRALDLMLRHAGRPAEEVLGTVDALKLRSCLTLFREAAPEEPRFARALAAFYDGAPDLRTLTLIGPRPGSG